MRVRHVRAADILFVTLGVALYAVLLCRSAVSALGKTVCLQASMTPKSTTQLVRLVQ